MAHNTSGHKQTQMALDPKDRPRYSKEQLQTYFERIKLPQKCLDSPVFTEPALAKTTEHGLPLVHAMTRYHAAFVPFENLELHYSSHKTISLNMDDLFTKFAERGLQYGRGGRCMENNGFFGTVLRSLGFDVRNCAGRVSRMHNPDRTVREQQGQTYDCWNHMLNLVRFDDEWYIVDVGMGAMGPNTPYPLRDGYETVSLSPRRIRLQWRSIPEHAAGRYEDAQKLWCYDVCYHPSETDPSSNIWTPTYCFTETEFLPQDYEMMSWFTSTHPKSFFTKSLLCTRMLMADRIEELVGDLTMFNDRVAKTVEGKRAVVRELKTEQERIDCLKEMFGINLTSEEKSGITVGVLES
ncbi:hypothetical protein BAUCODRAFT_66508 [Baudoinia panamericana UAMH 10762]|uniref:Uncharacterized protein n=1 Tax=Baudoinia panamericana (strain UAMH 10762) TaxID=717646 RepID=M2LTA9_BAUPA|nr:uncharacterized protein BAUCODRAFT_66508 [Baudoinia panamericana UAMH 10762]EMC97767.1 hypothetical protein BAUCODRAFT_66508 [Baudoinia panamericana UAMH 10762]